MSAFWAMCFARWLGMRPDFHVHRMLYGLETIRDANSICICCNPSGESNRAAATKRALCMHTVTESVRAMCVHFCIFDICAEANTYGISILYGEWWRSEREKTSWKRRAAFVRWILVVSADLFDDNNLGEEYFIPIDAGGAVLYSTRRCISANAEWPLGMLLEWAWP
jgi:hypothetical protein